MHEDLNLTLDQLKDSELSDEEFFESLDQLHVEKAISALGALSGLENSTMQPPHFYVEHYSRELYGFQELSQYLIWNIDVLEQIQQQPSDPPRHDIPFLLKALNQIQDVITALKKEHQRQQQLIFIKDLKTMTADLEDNPKLHPLTFSSLIDNLSFLFPQYLDGCAREHEYCPNIYPVIHAMRYYQALIDILQDKGQNAALPIENDQKDQLIETLEAWLEPLLELIHSLRISEIEDDIKSFECIEAASDDTQNDSFPLFNFAIFTNKANSAGHTLFQLFPDDIDLKELNKLHGTAASQYLIQILDKHLAPQAASDTVDKDELNVLKRLRQLLHQYRSKACILTIRSELPIYFPDKWWMDSFMNKCIGSSIIEIRQTLSYLLPSQMTKNRLKNDGLETIRSPDLALKVLQDCHKASQELLEQLDPNQSQTPNPSSGLEDPTLQELIDVLKDVNENILVGIKSLQQYINDMETTKAAQNFQNVLQELLKRPDTNQSQSPDSSPEDVSENFDETILDEEKLNSEHSGSVSSSTSRHPSRSPSFSSDKALNNEVLALLDDDNNNSNVNNPFDLSSLTQLIIGDTKHQMISKALEAYYYDYGGILSIENYYTEPLTTMKPLPSQHTNETEKDEEKLDLEHSDLVSSGTPRHPSRSPSFNSNKALNNEVLALLDDDNDVSAPSAYTYITMVDPALHLSSTIETPRPERIITEIYEPSASSSTTPEKQFTRSDSNDDGQHHIITPLSTPSEKYSSNTFDETLEIVDKNIQSTPTNKITLPEEIITTYSEPVVSTASSDVPITVDEYISKCSLGILFLSNIIIGLSFLYVVAIASWLPLVLVLVTAGMSIAWYGQFVDLQQEHSQVSGWQRNLWGFFSASLLTILIVNLLVTPMTAVTFLSVFELSFKIVLAATALSMLAMQFLRLKSYKPHITTCLTGDSNPTSMHHRKFELSNTATYSENSSPSDSHYSLTSSSCEPGRVEVIKNHNHEQIDVLSL